MSEIIQKNKIYLVKSKYGSFPFNNLQTAKQLNKVLNNYESITPTMEGHIKAIQNELNKIIGDLEKND